MGCARDTAAYDFSCILFTLFFFFVFSRIGRSYVAHLPNGFCMNFSRLISIYFPCDCLFLNKKRPMTLSDSESDRSAITTIWVCLLLLFVVVVDVAFLIFFFFACCIQMGNIVFH